MAHTYLIRKTLGIKDQNITLENKVNEKKIKGTIHLVYYGKLSYTPNGCRNCGIVNRSHADIVKNGTKESTIKLTHINFQPALLKLKKQRFYCKHCQSTFGAETNLVNRHCFISNIIKSTIAMELTELQPMTLIAKHLSVSSHTILRQLKQIGENMKPNYNYLPEHLSMDEFKSVKNVDAAMSFLFIDAQTHDVIDVIENRQQAYLSSYFLRYSLQARRKVKTVTMDMYSPYIGLVHQCFPNAEIIIDRFHIVQLLNRALNQVRIREMKKIRYLRPRDYRKLKRQWKLILKNDWDLNFEDYYTHRLYDGKVTEYIMLEYLLSLSPALSKAYQIVNRLKWALKNRRFEYFEEALNHAKETVYPQRIRTALTTLEKYLDPIKNAFVYTLSNGPIEGINNKIKNIKRSGYGYRNFRNLRSRIMISFTLTTDGLAPKTFYYQENEAV